MDEMVDQAASIFNEGTATLLESVEEASEDEPEETTEAIETVTEEVITEAEEPMELEESPRSFDTSLNKNSLSKEDDKVRAYYPLAPSKDKERNVVYFPFGDQEMTKVAKMVNCVSVFLECLDEAREGAANNCEEVFQECSGSSLITPDIYEQNSP